MDAPVMPIKAIKKTLLSELEEFRKLAQESLHANHVWHDTVPFEMLSIGYQHMQKALEACTTYDDLDNYIWYAGYRMSLEEWVNSL